MPTRFLSDAELAQVSGFPAEIADEDLVTYFTLVDADRRWLLDEHCGAANQLGLGVQLCTLPWLGFVPDDLAAAPPPAVRRLADQLGVDVGVLVDYGDGRTAPAAIICARCSPDRVGGELGPGSSRGSTTSCWPGPWNTTAPRCCCA